MIPVSQSIERKPPLPLKLVFFCGAESPYGYAHLAPLLADERFLIQAVIFAADERWQLFRKALLGAEAPTPPAPALSERVLGIARQATRGRLRDLPRRIRRKLRQPETASLPPALRLQYACHRAGVTTWTEFDVNSQGFAAKLRALQPDILFGAAYPQIFKRALLNIPAHGTINSHPSLLPRCRGAHPIFWSIASGETESGLTLHYMDENIDTGPVVARIAFPLDGALDYQGLYQKTISLIPALVSKLGEYFQDASLKPNPQDESRATLFREDRDIHHVLFWSHHQADHIKNLVRAAAGRAYFVVFGVKVLVRACSVSTTNRNLTNNIHVPNGTIVDLRGGISIKVADGVVTVHDWQALGDPRMEFHVGQFLV